LYGISALVYGDPYVRIVGTAMTVSSVLFVAALLKSRAPKRPKLSVFDRL
jgi:hypothetical protein